MTTLEVFVERGEQTALVGRAHMTRTRGQVSTTFVYDTAYLAGDAVAIDPALPLVAGAQHQPGLVGAFADSAPDRWGRNLVEKAERLRARGEERAPRRLDDVDFLLGVSDDTRQGALRFRHPGREEFLGEDSTVPRLISLPELLHAADEVATEDDPSAAVKQLLETGSTGLGGARPKASVRWDDGALGIAKFPHSGDRWDVMAWEATALDLLDAAGVRTPVHRLVRVGQRNALLLRRFDRTPRGHRIGYISAMTALGARDGEQRDYGEIAEAVRDLSAAPQQALRELYDRVTASVALGNTDDHLRNHGFLAAPRGWALSPAFDVNPNPDPWRPRATSIMGADTPPDEADGLLALAEECGLAPAEARARLERVTTALSTWQDTARSHRIPEREITVMGESLDPRMAAVRALL